MSTWRRTEQDKTPHLRMRLLGLSPLALGAAAAAPAGAVLLLAGAQGRHALAITENGETIRQGHTP